MIPRRCFLLSKLTEKIRKEGYRNGSDILEVGSFLNRMIDTELISELAEEFRDAFSNDEVTKILTVESGGIGIACMTAYKMKVPMVFARKSGKEPEKNSVSAIASGGGKKAFLSIPKGYITPADKVLIIDDFLGVGGATSALIDTVLKSKAALVGVGVLIERKYLGGGDSLRRRGIKLKALCKITSLDKEKGLLLEE